MATKALNIKDFAGYIKCGEILKSPLPNYQYPFILKCYQCDKINLILESFIIHIQEHCKEFLSKNENLIKDDEEESESIDNPLIKVESVMMEEDDPLVGIKDEDIEVNINNKRKNNIHKKDDNDDFEDFEDNSWYSEDEFQTDDAETDDDEDDELSNNSRNKKRKNVLPPIIENFIESKPNMKRLIELYKNRPNLWNRDLPFYRFKDKRQASMEEIAKDLNDRFCCEVTWKEVAGIIAYMYRKQRDDFRRLRNYEDDDKISKANSCKRSWFFEDLAFLRPKPVMQLHKLDSSMPDLTKEQVITIIQVYREFPHLWNSNLIEFICSNKRHVAHIEMLKIIEEKLDLKISLTILEQYLRTIHNYFSNEKRLRLKKNYCKSKKQADEYYEQLLYLYDHEGPFNCTDCRRVVSKPLGYKFHKSSHDNSVPFICSQCSRDFKTIQSYTLHAKRHFEDLEYACSICDKKFVSHGSLRLHILTHTSDRPYCCEMCGASYRQVQGLNRHRRRHQNRYSHTCQICSKGYYSKRSYEDHMNSHMNIRQHICQLCSKAFITRKALKVHAVTHEDARNHACQLCGKTFKLKIGVLQHMRTHGNPIESEIKNQQNKSRNKKRKSVLPPVIENFIESKPNMKRLIELYKNRPNLWNRDLPLYRFKDKRQASMEEIAKDLNDTFSSKVTWKEVSEIIAYMYRKQREDFRRLRNYEDDDKISKANSCKRSWFFEDLAFLRPKPVIQLHKLDSSLPDLTKDQVTAIIQVYREFPHLWNSNLIEFICSNKRLVAHNEMLKRIEASVNLNISLTILEQYLRTIHNYFSNEKRLRLKKNYCKSKKQADEYYEQLLYLYDHEGPFNCTDCKRVLPKPLGYKFHKSSHDNSVPFICSQCNRDFKTIQSYTVHAKRHFEDLEYACSICDKKFVAHGTLRLHLLTHTGDRPYCCEICGASYRQVQCLNRHRRRHQKRYSHTCHICSKGYYSKKTYEDHMNSHMNIRQHVCQLCGKAFITSKALKTHAVTHEDARNHACKLCGKTFKLKIGVLQHMRTHGSRMESEDKN